MKKAGQAKWAGLLNLADFHPMFICQTGWFSARLLIQRCK